MKIWQKTSGNQEAVERFTIGRDPEFDLILAPYDVLGSMAHAAMLQKIGLLSARENEQLQEGLRAIYQEIESGDFQIEKGVEDVHSQVEFLLTKRLGDVGKKLHSGRSRNDQVLVDLKLFYRAAVEELTIEIAGLGKTLDRLARRHAQDLMPGYTHTQLAMPSSFGVWFASFLEGLAEDVHLLKAAFDLCNKNPLGSAAGYGSSFPLDRSYTRDLLGFADLHHNVINAQNSRGKTERTLSFAMAGIAATLNRLADDVCLFMNQHFAFLSFPDELTTGSSIMPHKKNPDVFELIRAKTNQIQAVPQSISLLLTNSSTGYHRDLQLLKEEIFPALDSLKDCIRMTDFMLQSIQIRKNILSDRFYKHVFSVEEVNALVLKGMPFRDAYKQIGMAIESDQFSPAQDAVKHSHEGSIGNLCLDQINEKLVKGLAAFPFKEIERALTALKTAP